MGNVRIKKVNASENDFSEMSIQAILRSLRISKISDVYHIWLGSTEVEITSDLMKDLIQDAFMMLNYEDQEDLLKTFSEYVR